MSIMLIFSHQENLLKYEWNLTMPKHYNIYLQALRRYGVLQKVKFKITKELFIVLLPNCVLDLIN